MDIYLARQPIFDARRRAVAYELLARDGARNAFSGDPNVASQQTVDSTILAFGLDALLGSRDGFFNASRDFLTSDQWTFLPPARTVIEVLETVEPDEAVIRSCAAAKAAGYRIALDDFVFRQEYEALFSFTDIIKVDFLATAPAERTAMAQEFGARGITMLAEKLESYEDFHEAKAAGYTMFQGYFFCRPEVIATRDIPTSKASLAQLIAQVNRPDMDFEELESVIKRDVALSVRLLRYLRSAGLGWRHEVRSIEQALRVLGERQSRKWASLVAMSMIADDKPAELMTTTLLRAQFCEELGAVLKLPVQLADFFLTGLLSTLDALLDRPMDLILSQLSLCPDVHAALLGQENVLSNCLRAVSAYDRREWDDVDRFAADAGIAQSEVTCAYQRSLAWVANGALAN
jgi:EAL and modified HD-GYP domain-containing signal transduction protein